MKLYALAVVLVLGVSIGCDSEEEAAAAAQSQEAVSFNDHIVDLQGSVVSSMQAFMVADRDSPEESAALEHAISTCSAALKTLEETKAVAGGEELRVAAMELFQAYLLMAEWSRDLLAVETEADRQLLIEREPVISGRFTAAESHFDVMQQGFAAANQLVLLDEEVPGSAE